MSQGPQNYSFDPFKLGQVNVESQSFLVIFPIAFSIALFRLTATIEPLREPLAKAIELNIPKELIEKNNSKEQVRMVIGILEDRVFIYQIYLQVYLRLAICHPSNLLITYQDCQYFQESVLHQQFIHQVFPASDVKEFSFNLLFGLCASIFSQVALYFEFWC